MKYNLNLLFIHLFSVLIFVLSFILSLCAFDDFYSELFYYFRMYLYIVCAMSFLISMYTGLNLSHNKKVNYEGQK